MPTPIANTYLGDTLPRILIIDDNPQIHRDFDLVLIEEPQNPELDADEQRVYGLTTSANLPKRVYTLEHALSGQEGIEKVKQGMAEGRFYQLAFVDIRMPGLDGVETIAQIWRIDPRIQMVICTAYADYSQEDLIYKLGQTDKLLVLKKPFDSIEVTQLAITLTEKWNLARQAALKLEQMELLISQRTRNILELQRRKSHESCDLEQTDPADLAAIPKPDVQKSALILIVEYYADVSRQITLALGSEYETIVASSGSSGLQNAHETIPDAIIIDDALLQIDGMDVCRKLKAGPLTSHIPTIVLVAHAEDYQLKAMEAGADDCIVKPFNPTALKARVDGLLESRRKSRVVFHQGMAIQPRDLMVNQADAQFLRKTIAIIEQNMSDFEFDVDGLARKVAVSRRQLFRKLKAVIDLTPKAFIRAVRLKRAAQLLLESEMTVTEITFAVGFQDVKHFRTLFKEQFGTLPSDYVKQTELSP